MSLEVSVVIPVYNEEDVIEKNVITLKKYLDTIFNNYEIILSENGSNDTTLNIVKRLADATDKISFLTIPEPNLAEALKKGFQNAKSEKIVYYPIDLSVDLEFFKTSVDLLDSYDIVLGSKRMDANFDQRPLSRRVASKVYHGMTRQFYGVELTDTTCVKAYRKGKLLRILDRIPTTSRIFETELLIEAHRENFAITEVPVNVVENRTSRQGLIIKIQGKLEDLLSARLNVITYFVGLPIFLGGLIAIAILVLQKILKEDPTGFINPYSFMLSMLLVISGFQIITFGLLANLILKIRKEINR